MIRSFSITSYSSCEIVGTLYVDATRFGSIRLGSTRLGSAQARRSDIPPSCAPEFDTRNTESRKPIPAYPSP
ncbi:hypothetical protein Hanom_Chr11g00982321 [Helianthus anomalus]